MKTYHNEQGFTLIELLVALVVGMFVIAATVGLATLNHRSHFVQEQVVDAQQNARIALDMMVRDFRMAGYDPRGAGLFVTSVPADGATSFTIKADYNENGVLDADETVTYTFSTNDPYRYQIIRQTLADPNPIAVTPSNTVTGFELKTNCTPLPCTSGSITRVILTITTRTTNEDPYFTDSTGTFGVNVDGSASDGTARLRRLSTTVTLRNI